MDCEDSSAKLAAQRPDHVLTLCRRDETSMHQQIRRLVHSNAFVIQMQNLKFIHHVTDTLFYRFKKGIAGDREL